MEGQQEIVVAQYDPELPTAKDVLMAISCVATQYAMNPSLSLARTALRLASNLSAPEYANTESIKEVALRLTKQWDCVVEEYLLIEASVIPQHATLQ